MAEIIEVLYQYNQNMSVRSIERSLGVSRNTIKKYIQIANEININLRILDRQLIPDVAIEISKALNKNANGKTISLAKQQLISLHDVIQNLMNERHITFRQIWRLLKENHNVDFSETTLTRYINNYIVKKESSPVIVMPTIPGLQAQVDFTLVGNLYCNKQQKMRRAYAFMMTLSHSRMRFIYFVFKQDINMWLDCHRRAFEFFGGVPKIIVLDNLKAGVIKPDIYDPTINRAYSDCARYYGFVADPAKVRTPQHKGKVERTGTIVKQQVIAGRDHKNIADANQFALFWCRNEIANVICRTTGETPNERFTRDEKNQLLTLPQIAFEIPIWHCAIVQKDSHVTFQGSFYSVPFEYLNQSISLRAITRMVQIYDQNNQIIKTHARATHKGQWLTDWQDIPKAQREYVLQNKEQLISLASEFGDSIQQLVTIWLSPQLTETIKRKINYLFKLAKEFGKSRTELACKRALVYENYNIKSIERILKNNLEDQPIENQLNNYKTHQIAGAYLRDPQHFSIH